MGGKKKYVYICLVVVVLLIIGKRLGKTDIVSELHGQWKVTEFLACKQYGVSYSYYDDFLGRSRSKLLSGRILWQMSLDIRK